MTPLNTPEPSTWRFWASPGRQSPAPHRALAPPARSSQGKAVDVVDLVWEVLLPLLGQEAEVVYLKFKLNWMSCILIC